MPCESCTEHDLHPDLAHLAASIADHTAGPLTVALAELTSIMAAARNVRVVPSDRLAMFTTSVPSDHPVQVVGQQLDRVRLTIRNASETAAVSLGRDESVTGSTVGRFDLDAGEQLTLDTRAELWAVADGAGAVLSIITEESDG